LCIPQSRRVPPNIDMRSKLSGHRIRVFHIAVAIDLKRRPAMIFKHRHQAIRHRMQAQIRRNVTHPQPAVRRRIVRMPQNVRAQRLRIGSIPSQVFFEDMAQTLSRVELKRAQISAGNPGVGFDLLSALLTGNAFFHFAHVLQSRADIAERFGEIGLGCNRLAKRRDRFIQQLPRL
jgi:hypothetical protein